MLTSSRSSRVRLVCLMATSLVLVGGLGTGTASTMAKVDWLTYGYNVQRTGYNPSETVLGVANAANLHKLWSADLGAVVYAPSVLAHGVLVNGTPKDLVYVGTEHGDFYALNAAKGSVVWRQNLGSVSVGCAPHPDNIMGITSAAVIDRTAGLVYQAGGDGQVYALDLATGAV